MHCSSHRRAYRTNSHFDHARPSILGVRLCDWAEGHHYAQGRVGCDHTAVMVAVDAQHQRGEAVVLPPLPHAAASISAGKKHARFAYVWPLMKLTGGRGRRASAADESITFYPSVHLHETCSKVGGEFQLPL
jgi:hypothetical protein